MKREHESGLTCIRSDVTQYTWDLQCFWGLPVQVSLFAPLPNSHLEDTLKCTSSIVHWTVLTSRASTKQCITQTSIFTSRYADCWQLDKVAKLCAWLLGDCVVEVLSYFQSCAVVWSSSRMQQVGAETASGLSHAEANQIFPATECYCQENHHHRAEEESEQNSESVISLLKKIFTIISNAKYTRKLTCKPHSHCIAYIIVMTNTFFNFRLKK